MQHIFRNFQQARLIFQNKNSEAIQKSPPTPKLTSDKPYASDAKILQGAQGALDKLDKKKQPAKALKLLAELMGMEIIMKQIRGGRTLLERLNVAEKDVEEVTIDTMKKQLADSTTGLILRKALSGYAVELLKQKLTGKDFLDRLQIDPAKPLNDTQLEKWFSDPKFGYYLKIAFAAVAGEIMIKKSKGKTLLERLQIEESRPPQQKE